MADSSGPGLLLGLLIHGLARGWRVGSGSGGLSALSGSVSLLDVDDLILAQGSCVARTASAPLEVLLGFATGARVGVDVLCLAGDVWMYVGLHVALTSSAGGVCLRLDGRRLEILWLEVGRGRCPVAC